MYLATYSYPQRTSPPKPGALLGNAILNLQAAQRRAAAQHNFPSEEVPNSVYEIIAGGPATWENVSNVIKSQEGVTPHEIHGSQDEPLFFSLEQVSLHPPLPRPMSLRDFYAFEKHVTTAHKVRGKTVPDEWYQFPVFYFSNPNSVFGPGEIVPHPAYTAELDYELEVACVIGKTGINIPEEEAEAYIFGYTIFNDWSARDIQRQEMKVGLGPAKGKDFASSLGPWIVTPDEMQDRATGRPGVFDLEMTARLNGQIVSRGNWQDLHYSFGEMIARASQDAYLLPGDVIGSGTVGGGCLLEITGGRGPWLALGDVVELEIERLGVLRNTIVEPVPVRHS
jgi:fumarylacetoacetate (FAA) hydrolase